MKKIFFLAFFLFIFSFLIVSCHCKKKTTETVTTTPEVKRDYEKEGYVSANVFVSDMASCPYLLMLANEKKLEPSASLAAEFQKDKLPVWVKYAAKKGGVSVCMVGQIVDISDIQLRK